MAALQWLDSQNSTKWLLFQLLTAESYLDLGTKEKSTRVVTSGRLKTDVRILGVRLYWLPVQTRVPLKFGTETLTSVTCARVRVDVVDRNGKVHEGWGETPLSVQWAWPADLSYAERHTALQSFCQLLARAWNDFDVEGHALEIGHDFQFQVLPELLSRFNKDRSEQLQLPYLAALVCSSAFDIAVHDAYGRSNALPTYETYSESFLSRDLASFIGSDDDKSDFAGSYPSDFVLPSRRKQLAAWHLVGGLDPLSHDEVTTPIEPGYPVILEDWIRRDGLNCLKIKLRGTDADWDLERLIRVGNIAVENDVEALTADFNCTVMEPAYVLEILGALRTNHPETYRRILYVEQPFPYDLEKHAIDVRALSEEKPLLMDESAHDWKHVRYGHSLGWNGVALKTCKTQTGALLMSCWAQVHGMHLMVQDLTNPMLAQIPHVLLAAHTPTMMGVETNAMQFYPDASACEAEIHPGIYQRRDGCVDLQSIQGAGFGYRINEIQRTLPSPVFDSLGD